MSAPQLLLYDYPGSICSQMARLALEEKGATYRRQTVDIMNEEQFESWYTDLNPKAVVPTLSIDGEIVTDTIRIVHRVDRALAGPKLTPLDPAHAERMERLMGETMGLHYGVLLYSRRLEADGISPTIVARGKKLREQLAKHPERAELLERRIEGNGRLQKILSDPAETQQHIDAARELVSGFDGALAETDFLVTDQYTLADAFGTAALARFHLHGFNDWWSGGANPNVADYYRRMQERPSWQAAEVVNSASEREI